MKSKLLFILVFLTSSIFAKGQYFGKGTDKVLNIRVSDVQTHLKLDDRLSSFYGYIKQNDYDFFKGEDANGNEFHDKVKEVHNVYFTDYPIIDKEKDLFLFKLVALVERKVKKKETKDAYAFRYFSVQGRILKRKKQDNSGKMIDYYTLVKGKKVFGKLIELKDTDFQVRVGLKRRLAVVEDRKSDIKMLFPLGVGAFDEAVLHDDYSILTPRFKEGYMHRHPDVTLESRKKPRYYAGKPFIRILSDPNPGKGWTGIGFHIQPNEGRFIRAFDSHGCIRMQEEDLYTLYHIVSKGPRTTVPITVNYDIEEERYHPFPRQNRPYKRVLNTGSVENPDFVLDRDKLITTHRNSKDFAQWQLLEDREDDEYNVIYNYDSDWRIEEKVEEVAKQCKEKFVFNENAFKPTPGMSDFKKRKLAKKKKKAWEDNQEAIEECIEDITDGFRADTSMWYCLRVHGKRKC